MMMQARPNSTKTKKNFNSRSPITDEGILRGVLQIRRNRFRKESQTFMKEMMDVARSDTKSVRARSLDIPRYVRARGRHRLVGRLVGPRET